MIDTNYCKQISMWILWYTVLELTLCIVLVFKKLKHVISFRYFYLFRAGLIDHITRFIYRNKYAIMHWSLNLGFPNFKSIFQRMRFLLVATFFSICSFCLSLYSHFKHISSLDFNISSFKIWKQSRKRSRLYIWNYCPEVQSCFHISKRLLRDWFRPKWMCTLQVRSVWLGCPSYDQTS